MQKELPDIALLRQLIDYDPKTGILLWRMRDVSLFAKPGQATVWNQAYAGQRCFCTPRGAGYLGGTVCGVKIKTHRVVWALHCGEWPPSSQDIDHINHDRTDHRAANLRLVSRGDNNKNRPPQRNNSSGFVGISWNAECHKWFCSIGHKGQNVYLGVHACLGNAIRARREAERAFGFHGNHGGLA